MGNVPLPKIKYFGTSSIRIMKAVFYSTGLLGGMFMFFSACLYDVAPPQPPTCDGSFRIANTTLVPSDCLNPQGSITVEVEGGTGTYAYQLNEAEFQTSNQFEELAVGEYLITVRDGNDCRDTTSVRVNSTVSLNDDIMPIIRLNCAVQQCHNGEALPLIPLNTKQQVRAWAQRTKELTQIFEMPPPNFGSDLTRAEIQKIACWVEDGAP